MKGSRTIKLKIFVYLLLYFLYLSRRPDEGASTESRLNRIQSNDVLDVKYGFDRYKESVERLGWLMNMHPVS